MGQRVGTEGRERRDDGRRPATSRLYALGRSWTIFVVVLLVLLVLCCRFCCYAAAGSAGVAGVGTAAAAACALVATLMCMHGIICRHGSRSWPCWRPCVAYPA